MPNAQLTEQQMNIVGDMFSNSVGPTVASVAGTTNLGPYAIQHISGTNAITAWGNPTPDFVGTICIIPDAAFTTTATNNIAKATTAVANKALFITFDGSLWYPSY